MNVEVRLQSGLTNSSATAPRWYSSMRVQKALALLTVTSAGRQTQHWRVEL